MLLALCLLVAVGTCVAQQPQEETTVWSRRVVLSPGDLQLSWSPARDHVTLLVEARTQGYFVLSFSGVHSDTGAAQDAVLGWTQDAEVLLQDGVLRRDGRVAADVENNYELLQGARNETFLSISLKRPWSTCDDLEDFPLGAGSVLVSWALYPQPPEDLEIFPRLEEGERSGSLVIVFNAPPLPAAPATPGSLQLWPLLIPKVNLPVNDSHLQMCAIFPAPESFNQLWIVGFRAEIRHAESIQRMLVYECLGDSWGAAGEHIGLLAPGKPPQPCLTPVDTCNTLALAWTPGNDVMIFPSDIGIPVGSHFGGADFYMLQVLYSLSDNSVGTDNSGFQVHLSSSKRVRLEAAILEIGVKPQPLMVLPPRQAGFTTRGWCLQQCLSEMLPEDGIQVVSALLHTHAAGRRVLVRHLHGQGELPPLLMDTGYQSESQETRVLSPRVQVYAGDSLAVECQYSTQDRDRATMGGLGAEDEMCLAYLLYTPRTRLASCLSTPASSTSILDLIGLQSSADNALNNNHGQSLQNLTVMVSGKKVSLKNGLQMIDWGARSMASALVALQRELIYSTTHPYCVATDGTKVSSSESALPFYQEHLVSLEKVADCGAWEQARLLESQRNAATLVCTSYFLLMTLSIALVYVETK